MQKLNHLTARHLTDWPRNAAVPAAGFGTVSVPASVRHGSGPNLAFSPVIPPIPLFSTSVRYPAPQSAHLRVSHISNMHHLKSLQRRTANPVFSPSSNHSSFLRSRFFHPDDHFTPVFPTFANFFTFIFASALPPLGSQNDSIGTHSSSFLHSAICILHFNAVLHAWIF